MWTTKVMRAVEAVLAGLPKETTARGKDWHIARSLEVSQRTARNYRLNLVKEVPTKEWFKVPPLDKMRKLKAILSEAEFYGNSFLSKIKNMHNFIQEVEETLVLNKDKDSPEEEPRAGALGFLNPHTEGPNQELPCISRKSLDRGFTQNTGHGEGERKSLTKTPS